MNNSTTLAALCGAVHHKTAAAAERRLRNYGGLGYQSYLSMPIIESTETKYGATDCRSLFLNPEGLALLTGSKDPVGFLAFLLLHESLHAMLRHVLRCMGFEDRELANIACDYFVNGIIDDINKSVKGFDPFPIIDGAYLDQKLIEGHDVRSLYNYLLSQKPPEPPEGNDGNDGNDGNEGNDDGNDDGNDGNDDGQPDDLSDIHKGDFITPSLKGSETLQDFERDVNQKIEENAAQAAMDKLAGIAIGDDPILKKVVETRSEFQQVDWTEHVADWMDSSIEGGSFDGIDASLYAGTGLVEDIKSCRNVGDLVVFIDTSGSVVDDDPIVTSALDQLEGLMNNIRAKSVRVVHADNTVRWDEELRAGDVIDRELRGGWGTKFKPSFDWLSENVPNPAGVIYITDGEATDWRKVEEPDCPVLWLDYGWRRGESSPYFFGKVVSIDRE